MYKTYKQKKLEKLFAEIDTMCVCGRPIEWKNSRKFPQNYAIICETENFSIYRYLIFIMISIMTC